MTATMAICLAAGKGTRMQSDLPKVLVPACGKPLVEYVLSALDDCGVSKTVVVVGYQADKVRDALRHRDNVCFVEQAEQLGTGHAVQVCQEHFVDFDGAVAVVTGDSPLTQSSSLRALLELYHADRPACVLGTLHKADPAGLGRIIRDADGDFQAIVEEKDATPAQLQVTEVNMSTYVFDCQQLLRALRQLRNDNNQGEYYITDCPGIMRNSGLDVRALPVLKECEALSVNNLDDLALVETALRTTSP